MNHSGDPHDVLIGDGRPRPTSLLEEMPATAQFLDSLGLDFMYVRLGHAPADIAHLLHQHPATASNPETTTAFLAALTGHWHRNARKPAPPGAPGLRNYQHHAAAAGLALLDYRLG